MSQNDDLRHVLASAHAVLDQPPPPTLREILTAYRTKGDGDREMLLAMLNAKAAEDQRLSSVASLQRSLVDLYQQAPDALTSSPRNTSRQYPYPVPTGVYLDQRPSSSSSRVHASSRSRSPSRSMRGQAPSPYMHSSSRHDATMPEHPRKRHRASRSPIGAGAPAYEPLHPSEQFPPSPYSASERSDSAEHSPRSRASMAIGSLLSDGAPRRPDHTGTDPSAHQ